MTRKTAIYILAFAALGALIREAGAGMIANGDIVVVRALATSSSAAAVELDEYTTAGALVQSIALPTSAAAALTLSGSATSEGFLKQSTNGQYLTLAGYRATPATANPQTSTSTAVPRVVGRVKISDGTIDTSTALTDAYSGSNIRSAVSTDGTNLWTDGNGGSGQGTTAGARYSTLGGTTSTGLHSSATNQRVINIYNGQLYSSSSTGTNLGVNTIGTGLPTTSGQSIAGLPGMPTAGTHSNYDFFFSSPNTLYVADDGTAASDGGIQKWTLSGGTWTKAYTLLNNGAATTAVRGLTGYVDPISSQTVLFGTVAASSANNLIRVVDTGAASVSSTVATAAAGTVFRGVVYITPEPASAVLFLLAGIGLLGRRRRRRFDR